MSRFYSSGGFPSGSVGKCQCSETQNTQVQFLGREIPREEGMATHSSVLTWRTPWMENSKDGEAWQAKVHRVAQSQK